jgi:hypothetical protein
LKTQQKNEDESNKSKKVFRDMKKLDSWFNPKVTRAVEDYNHEVEITLNQINLALFSTEFIKEPKAFEEAKNYKTKGGV